jgi:quinol monooxygenase YgiN
MLSFQRLSSKILKQIKEDEGAANYAVRANLLKKHFWTLSIWKDQNSLRRFIMTEPHATAVKKFTEWAGEGSAFGEWSSPENTIDWPEALRKLQNPTYYYKK